MNWIIAGLGNPGSEYVGSRHNVGRDIARAIAEKEGMDVWKQDKKLCAEVAKGELFGKKAVVVLPDTYMNDSGSALASLIKSKKAAEQLIVLQDELDLPIGAVRISFGSGAGGHRGIASIQTALKTQDFVRIRIGISPATPAGKPRKPDSEKVVDFVLGTFSPAEKEKLKKVRETVHDAIELLIKEGRGKAMTEINSR